MWTAANLLKLAEMSLLMPLLQGRLDCHSEWPDAVPSAGLASALLVWCPGQTSRIPADLSRDHKKRMSIHTAKKLNRLNHFRLQS